MENQTPTTYEVVNEEILRKILNKFKNVLYSTFNNKENVGISFILKNPENIKTISIIAKKIELIEAEEVKQEERILDVIP